MFMRFVQLSIKPEAATAFERFYDHRVAPALLEENGCLFARLIRSTESDSEFISFTLWKSAAEAALYEDSGHYQALLAQNKPFQEASNEWKIQLTEDNTLEYRPVIEDPDVKAMPVVAGSDDEDAVEKISAQTYVRILSAQVNPDHFDDLKKTYDEEITPALLQVPGCQAAYLIGMPDTNEGLSITVWESEDMAVAYEESGTFDTLMKKALPYLSSLYQWKMTLDPSKQARTHMSNDVSIKGYKVVSGEDS